jgi:hypothetical protein
MHRPLKRLALGAVVAGAAAIAVPGVASAASTCTYGLGGPGGFTKTATIEAGSDLTMLRVVRQGQLIGFREGIGPIQLCAGATITNTDFIHVRVAPVLTPGSHPIIVDQSAGAFAPGATAEPDGNSEIEVLVDGPSAATLAVLGTTGSDTMRVTSGGGVMLGTDLDNDVRHRNTGSINVSGFTGNDFISGRGGGSNPPANVNLFLFGDGGNDTVVDGPRADELFGGSDDDTLFSADGLGIDRNFGNLGLDKATIDSGERVEAIEAVTLASIGRLRLADDVVEAKAGGVAHVEMSWTHPKAWQQLKKVALRIADGGDVVGSVVVRPKSGRVTGKLLAKGSTIDNHGKTVTAKLALRLPKSLAGKRLRLDVEATDRTGKSQLEPDAALIAIR